MIVEGGRRSILCDFVGQLALQSQKPEIAILFNDMLTDAACVVEFDVETAGKNGEER